MTASDTLKSDTPKTPGFCLQCNSDLQLSNEDRYYVCLCGRESTSSYYLPFGWILNNSFTTDVLHNSGQQLSQLAKAASAKSHG